MGRTGAEHGQNMFYPCSALVVFMIIPCNLLSYCGLIDAKIRASDKDLPVQLNFQFFRSEQILITVFAPF